MQLHRMILCCDALSGECLVAMTATQLAAGVTPELFGAGLAAGDPPSHTSHGH